MAGRYSPATAHRVTCCHSGPNVQNNRPNSTHPIADPRAVHHENGNSSRDERSSDKVLAEVELRDVHLRIGSKRIINGLNLRIARGESLAIIGTSGTG